MKIFSNFIFEKLNFRKTKNSFEMFFWIFLIKFSLNQNAKKKFSADSNADWTRLFKMSILISLIKAWGPKALMLSYDRCSLIWYVKLMICYEVLKETDIIESMAR